MERVISVSFFLLDSRLLFEVVGWWNVIFFVESTCKAILFGNVACFFDFFCDFFFFVLVFFCGWE